MNMGRIKGIHRCARRLLAGGACLLALSSPGAWSSMRERELFELQHLSWSPRDGAPSNITSLAQSVDGFLWIGTQDGLYRFDGVRFETSDRRTGLRYPTGVVLGLYAPPEGGLWMRVSSTGDSLAYLHDGEIEFHGQSDGVPGGSERQLLEDAEDRLWVVTPQGLCGREQKGFHCVGGEEGFVDKGAFAAVVDADGTMWIVGTAHLFRRLRGSAHFEAVLDLHGAAVRHIAAGPDHRLWLASPKGSVRGLKVLPEGGINETVEVRVGSDGLVVDRDGSLWIGTSGQGLRRLRAPEQLEAGTIVDGAAPLDAYTEKQGLSGDHVWPVLIDRDGNLWVGTNGGLDRFRASPLVTANLPPGGFDFALAAGDDGTLWAGISNHPLMHLSGPAPVAIAGAPAGMSCAYRDADGTVWFGGGQGIFRAERGTLSRVAPLPAAVGSTTDTEIQAMVRDRAGALWVSIAGEEGYYRYAAGSWTLFKNPEGIRSTWYPESMALDEAGRLWIGYPRDLVAVIDGGHATVYALNEGRDMGDVAALFPMGKGVWIGGEKGLAYFDGSRVRTIVPADPGEFELVSGIVETRSGELWLRSRAGLLRFGALDVQRALAGGPLSGRVYDYLDGVPSQAPGLRPAPTLVQGTDGRLWLSNATGVVWIDPALADPARAPPQVHIDSLTAGEHDYTASGAALPARTTRLRIGYTAADLSLPQRLRFHYRLAGVDAGWQDAGASREASYTNLSPGQYRFEIQAINAEGTPSANASSLVFSIAPAFWQTAWFRLFAAAAALLLLVALYRMRMGYVVGRVNELHRERLVERERIARDLHDTLLQGVQGLILRFQATVLGMRDDDPARTEIQSTLTRANRVLAEGRDKVLGLRRSGPAEADLACAFADLAKELAQPPAPEFRITTEGTIRTVSPTIHDELFRIGAEALNNAFRHSQARNIEMELTFAPTELRLRIRDDGQGIPADVIQAGARAGHWGLPGIRERATRIRARLELWSGPGKGTEIALRVPGFVAYADAAPGFIRRLLGGLSDSRPGEGKA